MIVNRRVFHTRTGKMQETIAHLQAGLKDLPYPYRIYGSFTGRFNTVVMELEFTDLAQMQEAETARDANPATADWMAHWRTLVHSDGTNEIWTLAENR